MTKTPYKKVQQGDPFKPSASFHNDTVDVIREAKKSGVKRPHDRNRDTRTNTVKAYNASAEDAPYRGICEISDTSNTNAQVEFVKPGASDGVGQYGVILQPIQSGSIGEIAISGGPWEVKYADSVTDSDVVAGYCLGPEDGSWLAVKGDLVNVQRNIDMGNNIVRCTFAGGGTGGGLLLQAAEDMTENYDDTNETTIANTTYQAYPVESNGDLGDAIDVIRSPGVYVEAGQRGVLSVSNDGIKVFSLAPYQIEIRPDDPPEDELYEGRMWIIS